MNGGLETLEQGEPHLEDLDGLMLGRAAYHMPWVLAEVDSKIYDAANPCATRRDAVIAMLPYIEQQLSQGLFLHRVTRHMLGLYHSQPGGRMWRQIISTESCKPSADTKVLLRALDVVEEQAARQAEAA